MRKIAWADVASLLRLHIVGVALLATLVFGWLFTGEHPFVLVPFVAIDWFVINLVNRVTDLAEDVANQVPGADIAAARKRQLEVLSIVAFVASLAVSHLWVSAELTPLRLLVQAIGLAYNFRLIPTPRGRTRFKELYFFKNTMSAVLFVLTCIAYPLAWSARIVPWTTVAAITAFFVPFELSYEVLYDFRDLEGDRREGVPTYPVVHGPETARRILDGLLVGSALALVGAFFARWVGARELLMLAAPALQWGLSAPRLRRGLDHRDCVLITHLGSAQLLLFLVGTQLWLWAGLPANVFLGGGAAP